MGFEYFQTIVQFRINTDNGSVDILKKFTTPFAETRNKTVKKKVPKTLIAQEIQEEFI